jgi:hypothetical protein
VEVLGPKGPSEHTGADLIPWARNQLVIADQIMDNPGGGLAFAASAVGQVEAALAELAESSEVVRHRWEPVVELLNRVEDDMIRRHFDSARAGLAEAMKALVEGEARQPA